MVSDVVGGLQCCLWKSFKALIKDSFVYFDISRDEIWTCIYDKSIPRLQIMPDDPRLNHRAGSIHDVVV